MFFFLAWSLLFWQGWMYLLSALSNDSLITKSTKYIWLLNSLFQSSNHLSLIMLTKLVNSSARGLSKITVTQDDALQWRSIYYNALQLVYFSFLTSKRRHAGEYMSKLKCWFYTVNIYCAVGMDSLIFPGNRDDIEWHNQQRSYFQIHTLLPSECIGKYWPRDNISWYTS